MLVKTMPIAVGIILTSIASVKLVTDQLHINLKV